VNIRERKKGERRKRTKIGIVTYSRGGDRNINFGTTLVKIVLDVTTPLTIVIV
jgi:hypothetical protein